MKIAITSDIHIEFGDLDLKNDHRSDVLILGGDIIIGNEVASDHVTEGPSHKKIATEFFKRVSQEFEYVVYVAGNHEFYHGKFDRTILDLKEFVSQFPNVHFLERESIKIGDYHFVGATLWTNMNDSDPLTQHICMNRMNDYRLISNDKLGHTRLRPAHTIDRHYLTTGYIRQTIANNPTDKYVVVTHHAPTTMSEHPKYERQKEMNGAYRTDLSDFILEHPQIKLWTHGHTHYEFDYMVGDTRVVCNPRGYVGYERSVDLKYNPKVVEL